MKIVFFNYLMIIFIIFVILFICFIFHLDFLDLLLYPLKFILSYLRIIEFYL